MKLYFKHISIITLLLAHAGCGEEKGEDIPISDIGLDTTDLLTTLDLDGSWEPVADSGPVARSSAITLALSNKMWIYGGTNEDVEDSDLETLWVFDPSTLAWTQEFDAIPSEAADGFDGVAVLKGDSLLLTVSNSKGASAGAYGTAVYDISDNTFVDLELTSAPKSAAFIASLGDSEKVVTFDASTGTGAIYSEGNEWAELPTENAPAACSNCYPVISGTNLIVWGGHDPEETTAYLGTGSIYNEDTGAWTVMSSTNAPDARSHYCVAADSTRVFLYGGRDDNLLLDGYVYTVSTDIWEQIPTADSPGTNFYTHCSVTDNKFFIWGGYYYQTESYPQTGFVYDVANSNWSNLSTTNAPVGRIQASVFSYDNQLVIWGGDEPDADGNASPLANGGVYSIGISD